MMKTITKLLVCLVVLSFGCAKPQMKSAAESNDRHPTLALDNLKIGLLADSQIQTDKSSRWVPLLSGKIEDVVVPVALRPPALNLYSKDLLEHFLDQLVEAKVNLILYLGDAANNGCKDEIDTVMSILENARKAHEIPIFFVLGNHDYLGGGNTPYMPDRQKLCDSSRPEFGKDLNRPLSKYELILRIHDFNKASGMMLADWKYEDNLDNDNHHFGSGELFRRCVNSASEPDEKADMRHQHRKPGCYLAGKVFNPKLKLELLLLDTSDYADKRITYYMESIKKGFFGISGWVSTESVPGVDSQLDALINLKEKAPPAARIIVSHYPVRELAPVFRAVSLFSKLPRQLVPLFYPAPLLGNYWLSGHTHHPPKIAQEDLPAKVFGGSDASVIHMLNIGSTSDSKKDKGKIADPHAVVATILKGDYEGVVNPIEIDRKIDTSQLACEEIIHLLKEQPAVGFPNYYPVSDRVAGRAMFGVCTNYRQPDWKNTDSIHAIKNLELFVEHLKAHATAYPGIDPNLIEVCIAREASRMEAIEKIDKPCKK